MVSVIEIKQRRRDYWDRELSKFESVHPLNAFGWGKVRAMDGWRPIYLVAKRGSGVCGAVMLLIKPIGPTRLSIMYAPRGPLFDLHDSDTLNALLYRIRMEAKKCRAIFIRIDPNITEEAIRMNGNDPFLDAGFARLGHRWSMWNAPCDVYRTDLSKSENEQQLFSRISPKARTGIRKAEKDGVAIRQGTSPKDVGTFYNIFKRFAIKKGFMYRTLEYQKRLFSEYISTGNGALFLSIYQGSVAGGQICIRLGALCVEMHRCVDYQYHKHRINEALVWEGLKWAQEKGCMWYCQRGEGSPTLAKFKEKFDAELVHLVGYYDLPFRRRLYSYFTFLEFKVLPALVSLGAKRLKNLHKLVNQLAPHTTR